MSYMSELHLDLLDTMDKTYAMDSDNAYTLSHMKAAVEQELCQRGFRKEQAESMSNSFVDEWEFIEF